MKARLVNLGIFATMMEVWGRFPQGGIEGDYVVVDGKELLWNKYDHTWGMSSVTSTDAIRPLPPKGSEDVHPQAQEALDSLRAYVTTRLNELHEKVGASGGIAPLDKDGYIPSRHLPPEESLAHQLRAELSDSISPLTARVMRLLQGDPALQFVFVESPSTGRRVEHIVRYDTSTKSLAVPGGIIRHLSLGIDGVSPSRDLSDYKTWALPAEEVKVADDVRNLYLYARCSKTDGAGAFVTSETLLPMEGVSGYYDLLVGVLSSLPNRVFTPLYGLVEIPSAMLRIDKLMSPDGEFVIDLVRKEIRGAKTSFATGGGDAEEILQGLLSQAKTYTDSKSDGVKSYIDTKSTSTRSYVDSKLTESGRKLQEKADELTTILQGYTDGKTLESKRYIEAQVEALRQIINDGLGEVSRINEGFAQLQAQIDGKVSNWYYAGTPSATTEPTSLWTTEELRRAHIGDTFTSLDKPPSPYAGKSWRYSPSFVWEEMVDTDSLKALQLATEAKATADGKTTTYLTQPTSYQQGDSWVLTAATAISGVTHPRGAILFARESSSAFNALHWVRLDDYISSTEAKGYTESQAGRALADAKRYADQGDKTTAQRIDQRSSDTLTGAKNYADGKLAEAKSYAEDKVFEVRRATEVARVESEHRLSIHAEEKARQAGEQAKDYTDTQLKSIQDNAQMLAYLRAAIQDGTTDVYGGLILSSFLGARDPETKTIRSFIAGSSEKNLPALAAGVSAFGTPQEKRVVEINHDGTGHWGLMRVADGGRVLKIGPMTFGGDFPKGIFQEARPLLLDDPRAKYSNIYIGEQGAVFAFALGGAGGYVRLCNLTTRTSLEVKGKVNIPGVLLAARVEPTITFSSRWGALDVSVTRPDRGRYRFAHQLRHTRYVVQATAIGSDTGNCVVTEQTASSFTVDVYESGRSTDRLAFNVLVIGDN